MKQKFSTSDWNHLAKTRLRRILKIAQTYPKLFKMGPSEPWQAGVEIVGKTKMIRLNGSYRNKYYPTDVLSFPVEFPFRESGLLGELVICLPVLRSQALSLGHQPQLELDILLIHGVLHLLGLDHEKSSKEAALMAQWEIRMLKKLCPSLAGLRPEKELGLINRANLDMED